MTNPQEKESQNRIDSIITLILEEARTVKDANPATAVYCVLMKIHGRLMEIMRIME